MTVSKFFYFLGVGAGLSMDAFALSVANCTAFKDQLNKKRQFLMPCVFAFFQFLMPVIGFYIGSLFSRFLNDFAGYLTAGVFFILALKIVIDNVKDAKKEECENKEKKKFGALFLILQGLATSIDALIIGVTFPSSVPHPYFASLIIGAVTFLIVMVGVLLGKALGKALESRAKWVGAIVLFALAIKNLVTAII